MTLRRALALLGLALFLGTAAGEARAAASDACPRAWNDTFRSANRTFMPPPLRGRWTWNRDQAWTESNCRPRVCSQVGACGVLQLMPGTWRDMTAAAKASGSVFEPRLNIVLGVKYMGWQCRQWLGRPRTAPEIFALCAAAYNAGLGHILKAQTLCGGARTWPGVAECLPDVTGHHSKETIDYVRRIEALR